MRVHNQRVGALHSFQFLFSFSGKREKATVSGIHMVPQFIFRGNVRYRIQWIYRASVGGSSRSNDKKWIQTFSLIFFYKRFKGRCLYPPTDRKSTRLNSSHI